MWIQGQIMTISACPISGKDSQMLAKETFLDPVPVAGVPEHFPLPLLGIGLAGLGFVRPR